MKEIFRQVKGDKIIKWGMNISIVLLGIEFLCIFIFYFSLPPLIPLFNQMPWGESRLGTKLAIFLPPLITLSFLVLNFSLLAHLYDKIPLASRILSITTLLVTLLSFISIAQTLRIIL